MSIHEQGKCSVMHFSGSLVLPANRTGHQAAWPRRGGATAFLCAFVVWVASVDRVSELNSLKWALLTWRSLLWSAGEQEKKLFMVLNFAPISATCECIPVHPHFPMHSAKLGSPLKWINLLSTCKVNTKRHRQKFKFLHKFSELFTLCVLACRVFYNMQAMRSPLRLAFYCRILQADTCIQTF